MMYSSPFVFAVIVVSVLVWMYTYHFTEWFLHRDPVLEELKLQLASVEPFLQNLQLYEGSKSYTLNKQRVFICTKDAHGRYYPRNMLVYVLLHELAHVKCAEIGHTPLFFDIFQQLLKKAEAQGLYDPSVPPLLDYCGH